jgi:hypothetical protein
MEEGDGVAVLHITPWGFCWFSLGCSWAGLGQARNKGEMGCAQEREGKRVSLFFFPKTVFLYFVSNFFCYLKLFCIFFKLSELFKYHMGFLKEKCHVG